ERDLLKLSISTEGWAFTESDMWYFEPGSGGDPQPRFLLHRREDENVRLREVYYFADGQVQAWEKSRVFLRLAGAPEVREAVARSLSPTCGWTYQADGSPLQYYDAGYARRVAEFEAQRLAYARQKTQTCIRQLEAAGLEENGPNAMYNNFTLQADRPEGKQGQEPPMDTYFVSPRLYAWVVGE
ncbi:MAG: hypothetical protein D6722_19885, partial [Bacteroidetes bacterium]